ncbi:MAG: S41 family peptidase [Anaerovoracaceae bacterium]
MNSKKTNVVLVAIIAFLLGGAVFTAVAFGFAGLGETEIKLNINGSKSQDKYKISEEIFQLIDEDYYKKVNSEDTITWMNKGIVAGLNDPYSSYFTKEEFNEFLISVNGEFDGIGISFIKKKDGSFEIVKVVEDSPADKSGLKKHDIIRSVDDKDVSKIKDVASVLRGKAGTFVKITVERKDKLIDFKIKRDTIESEKLEVKHLKDNVGYIKILGFDRGTFDLFKRELDQMEADNTESLVIDLRDNGGGLVDEAVKITDELLGKCKIATVRDKNGIKDTYKSDSKKTLLPFVVLVNENTASASEIMASAIKDNDAAKLVGTKTFGKGVIQNTIKLSNGGALKLTVGEYYSANGHKINKKGISPDYNVKDSKKQLKKAIDLLI